MPEVVETFQFTARELAKQFAKESVLPDALLLLNKAYTEQTPSTPEQIDSGDKSALDILSLQSDVEIIATLLGYEALDPRIARWSDSDVRNALKNAAFHGENGTNATTWKKRQLTQSGLTQTLIQKGVTAAEQRIFHLNGLVVNLDKKTAPSLEIASSK